MLASLESTWNQCHQLESDLLPANVISGIAPPIEVGYVFILTYTFLSQSIGLVSKLSLTSNVGGLSILNDS